MSATAVVQKATDSKQVVVFRVAEEEFAVGIDSVREIIPMTEITSIPRAPAFVRGILDLRGMVIPIIDLRERFDLGEAGNEDETRITVVEMAGHVVGCIVDDVEEVLTLPAEAIQPPPATAISVDSEYLLGVARHDGRLLILLDLDRVLSEHQQQALSSVAEPMEELEAAAT
ncbi:MAG: chemotaxis protein CheW [Armatimonadia bacterium]|nr:chemotaxis protein CheW [Armatimonadia bacterium]